MRIFCQGRFQDQLSSDKGTQTVLDVVSAANQLREAHQTPGLMGLSGNVFSTIWHGIAGIAAPPSGFTTIWYWIDGTIGLSLANIDLVALAALVFSIICILGGWYHYHCIIPNASWFNGPESILAHHLTTVIGLACLGWAGHLIHVACPIEVLLSCG